MKELKRLSARLKEADPPRVALVSAQDPFLADEAIALLRNAMPQAQHVRLHADENGVEDLLDSHLCMSLFASSKVILLDRVHTLRKEGRSKLVPLLENAAEAVPPGLMVILLGGDKPLKEALLGRRKLPPGCEAWHFKRIYAGRELDGFVRSRLSAFGLRPGGGLLEAVTEWYENADRELGALAGELDKLAAYVGGGSSEATADDWRRVASQPLTARSWEYVDALCTRRARESVESLRELLESGMHPQAVVSVLARRIRALLLARLAAELGAAGPALRRAAEEQLSLPPYKYARRLEIGRMLKERLSTLASEHSLPAGALEPESPLVMGARVRAALRLPLRLLEDAAAALALLEYLPRTRGIPQELVLERFTIGFCRGTPLEYLTRALS